MYGWIALALVGASCAAHAPAPLLVASAGGPVPAGRQPAKVVAADLDGDRDLDLLVASAGSKELAALLGDGRGGFSRGPRTSLGGAVPTNRLAIGDLDGDGRPDAVVGSHDANAVRVWLGDGAGGFREAAGSPVEVVAGFEPHNHGLALADLDGDGRLDVATSNHAAGSVSVLLGDGAGGFRPASGSPFATGRGPYTFALGDVDRDGRLDVATPDVGAGTASVLSGAGGGALAPARSTAVDRRPYFAALADLQGDGWPDLVLSHDESERLTVLLGGGEGFRPQAQWRVDVGARPVPVEVADLDADGKADLVVGTASHQVAVLLGDGRGGFRPAPGSPLPAGRGPWSLLVADLDADGRLDVVTANFESDDLTLLFGR